MNAKRSIKKSERNNPVKKSVRVVKDKIAKKNDREQRGEK